LWHGGTLGGDLRTKNPRPTTTLHTGADRLLAVKDAPDAGRPKKWCGTEHAIKELSTAATREVEALASNHVEADTRMVLHAVHSASFPRTIVRCDDTDVLVLLLYYQSEGL